MLRQAVLCMIRSAWPMMMEGCTADNHCSPGCSMFMATNCLKEKAGNIGNLTFVKELTKCRGKNLVSKSFQLGDISV